MLNETTEYLLYKLTEIHNHYLEEIDKISSLVFNIIEHETGIPQEEQLNFYKDNKLSVTDIINFTRQNLIIHKYENKSQESHSKTVFMGSLNGIIFRSDEEADEVYVHASSEGIKEVLGADYREQVIEDYVVLDTADSEESGMFRGVEVNFPYLIMGYNSGQIVSLDKDVINEIITNSTLLKYFDPDGIENLEGPEDRTFGFFEYHESEPEPQINKNIAID